MGKSNSCESEWGQWQTEACILCLLSRAPKLMPYTFTNCLSFSFLAERCAVTVAPNSGSAGLLSHSLSESPAKSGNDLSLSWKTKLQVSPSLFSSHCVCVSCAKQPTQFHCTTVRVTNKVPLTSVLSSSTLSFDITIVSESLQNVNQSRN